MKSTKATEPACPVNETEVAGSVARSLADLHGAPGHLFRRARQFHDALWLQFIGESLTPLQYAVLVAVEAEPELSQRALGERVALDTSTVSDLVARLARRGLLLRRPDPNDARKRVLLVTAAGRKVLGQAKRAAAEMGHQILAPLEPDERGELIRLLDKLVFSELALTSTDNLDYARRSSPQQSEAGHVQRSDG